MDAMVARMGVDELEVVGCINTDRKTFAYNPEYLNQPYAKPISVSLPLTAEAYSEEGFRPYFEGLLPEGDARRALAAELSVRDDDYLALLMRCGSECIGDVILLTSDVEPLSYDPISSDSLKETFNSMPLMSQSNIKTRMSLAGTRGKIALARFDGETSPEGWLRPLGSAASTHILKVDQMRGMAELEYVCMTAAAACGLSVARTSLIDFGSATVLCSERFDRMVEHNCEGTAAVRRLHQEDFCQAFGLLPGSKYAELSEGSLASIAHLIRSESEQPAMDVAQLIKVMCFNYLIGNCDNHLKNMSIQYGASWCGFRLAPAYDLVSTTLFPRFVRTMGMAIGGQSDIDQVTAEHWAAYAQEMGATSRMVKRLCKQVFDALPKALMKAAAGVESGFPLAVAMADDLEEDMMPRMAVMEEYIAS